MRSEFSEHYRTLPKHELFEVVLEKERYQKEAIECAISEIKRRNLDQEVADILNSKVQKNKSDKEEDEFWDNYEYSDEGWQYQLAIFSESADIPVFEQRLEANNIIYNKTKDDEDGLMISRYTFHKNVFEKAEELLEKIYNEKPEEVGDKKDSTWIRIAMMVGNSIMILSLVALAIVFLIILFM